FRPTHFQETSTHFVRTGSNSFDERLERASGQTKFVRNENGPVIANESTNGGYVGYSGNRCELVAQIPILQAAQVGQTSLMAVVHKCVFIDPSRAGRIRPDDRMHARGQAARDLL